MEGKVVLEIQEDSKSADINPITDKSTAKSVEIIASEANELNAVEVSDELVNKIAAESKDFNTENNTAETVQAETASGTPEEPVTNDTNVENENDKGTELYDDVKDKSKESDSRDLEETSDNVKETVAGENESSKENDAATTALDHGKGDIDITKEPVIEEQKVQTTLDKKEETIDETSSPAVKETVSFLDNPIATLSDPAEKESQEDTSTVLQRKKSFESEFEQFLCHPRDETVASDNDSKSMDLKTSIPPESDMKDTEDLKKFNQFCPEETSNSSWYKMAKNKEPMDIAETSFLGDENSNMSIPENASVVSSNIGEDSRLSFQVDESSNLSLPDDGSSVPTFAGHQPVFDESANMNPPSNVTFLSPDTPCGMNVDTCTNMSESTTASKRNRRGTLQQAADDANEHGHNITAADIFEYQWPQDMDADWFILQEQLSVYLDVKSFKRKYPEIFRRVCDKHEKDFLREKGVVTETQSDLGLTALKSEDVHELMNRDYPSKYKEFLKILHEREKRRMAERLKELDAPRLEKEKMVEYTKKAMKSSSEWNRKLLKERNKERRAYFDMQTFTTHFPKGKFKRLKPNPTEQTAYPISLIPGQFQEYFREYSPEELKRFPLNSVAVNPPKKNDPVAKLQEQIIRRRQQQQLALQQTVNIGNVVEQPPKAIRPIRRQIENNDQTDGAGSDTEEESKKKAETKAEDKTIERLSNKLKKKENSISREASKEKSVEPITIKKEADDCHICKNEKDKSKIPAGEELIKCSECNRTGHPGCLDLTDAMVKVIKTYNWQCMECKTCVQCMDPYDEDKMLFCDNCDRGYHTFCVGLKSLPTGKWECKSCTGDTTPIIPLPRPPPKAKRGRKPKDPNGPASSTPAKAPKEKETTSKPTPIRSTPRREAKDLEKSNTKDAKETK